MTPTIDAPAPSAAPVSTPAPAAPSTPHATNPRDAMKNFDFSAVSQGVIDGTKTRPGAVAPAVKPQVATPSPMSTPVQPEAADADPMADGQPEMDLDDELASLSSIDPAQKKIEMRRARFNDLYQSHKSWKQISDVMPTVEDAKAAYSKSTDLDQLHADFDSGDPAAVDGFLNYWVSNSPRGVAAMAERFPDVLRQSNPQAYEGLQARIVSDVTEANYAAAAGDPEAFHRAQMFEWTQTGKYRQPGDVKPVDPLAQREAAIQAKEQEFQRQEQQAKEQKTTQWNQSTYKDIAKTIDSEIVKTLGPAAKAYDPAVLGMLVNQIRLELTKQVQNDQTWMTNFNLSFSRAQGMQTPEAQQAIKDFYLQKARTLIKSVAKPLVSKATQAAVQSNQQQHQRSQAASLQTAPNGGKPVNPGAPSAVRPNATLQEKIAANFLQRGFHN